MRKLKISVGQSRFDKKWKNIETSWPKLLKRFEETVTTYETQKAYLKMDKLKQDNIKDIGGFVGGHLREGKRRNGYMLERSMLSLDADHAGPEFWEEFKDLSTYAAAVYSTHKHTSDKPRLRLVIPLDRDVSPDEYEAIGRRVAFSLGIDDFDDTTYQPTRLMYWPSTSKDGEFFFDHIEGDFLSADEILSTYEDWTDIGSWPYSSRVEAVQRRQAKVQGDPLEKHGSVGAFCKTYTITDAISEFLSDVYEETSIDDRYTYVNGSTAGGLVIYDDKFAYSNHATDPISGKLCNAFDLVRLHLYGDMDEDSEEDELVTKLPSYLKMQELSDKDTNVKKSMFRERQQNVKSDFEGLFEEDSVLEVVEFDESLDVEMEAVPAAGNKRRRTIKKRVREVIDYEDDSWQERLEYAKGKLINNIHNPRLILEHTVALENVCALNEFNGRKEVLGGLPWDKDRAFGSPWTDTDDRNLRLHFEREYKFKGDKNLLDATEIVHEKRAFHPVRDMLDRLEWDGVERLDTLLIDYLGAEDTEFTRAVTRKSVTAAIARIYEPGIKFDYMLTLTGPQGCGKSTIIKKLSKGYFTDSLTSVGTKDAYDQIQSVWFVEMAELTATRKADVEATKQFISKTEDVYRQAYKHNTGVFKRQCVFWATTNDDSFLKDLTGNRRFWPVRVSKSTSLSVWDLTEKNIDQLLAEAKYRYEEGETLFLNRELEDVAVSIQKGHMMEDTWEGMIEVYLETLLPRNWPTMSGSDRQMVFSEDMGFEGYWLRGRVCSMEIWEQCLGNTRAKMSNADSYRINSIMRNMAGWEASKSTVEFRKYGPQRGFIRKTKSDKSDKVLRKP